MKTVAYALVALGLALPTVATAMTPEQTLHSDKARSIFLQLQEESKSDE